MPSTIVERVDVAPGLEERTTATGKTVWRSTVYAAGTQETKTLKARNRTEAKMLHRQHQVDFRERSGKVLAADYDPQRTVEQAVGAALEYFESTIGLDGGYSRGAIDNYRSAFKQRIKGQPIAKVRLVDLEKPHALAFLRNLKRSGLAPFTQNGTVTALRTSLRYAREQDWMKTDPFLGIDRKKEFPKQKVKTEPQSLSADEVFKFMDAVGSAEFAASSDTDFRNVITVLRLEGMRVSELLGCRWNEVDWTEGRLLLDDQLARDQKTTEAARWSRPKNDDKGVRNAKVFAPSMEALANQLELEVAKSLGQPDDLIFTQASGRPMTRGLILKAVRRAAKIAGVEVTPKTLRTSFLTGAAHAGIAAVEIATKTGNSPAVIDRFYVKPIRTAAQEDENMRRMIEYGHVG